MKIHLLNIIFDSKFTNILIWISNSFVYDAEFLNKQSSFQIFNRARFEKYYL